MVLLEPPKKREKSRLSVLRRNSLRDIVSDFIKGSVTMNCAELQNKRVKKTHSNSISESGMTTAITLK